MRFVTGDDRSDPIGIFDSGLGGLTVLSVLMETFPSQSFVYLGDSARLPYGTKSKETIRRYAAEAAHFFLKNNCCAVIVACNTACALAFDVFEEQFSGPCYSILESSVEAAVESATKSVLVLATFATVKSEAYLKRFYEIAPDLKVEQIACPLLVPLIEEGLRQHSITENVIHHYLSQSQTSWDTLVLACTHYPLLWPIFKKIHPEKKIVHGAELLSQRLKREGLVGGGQSKIDLFCTDDSGYQNHLIHSILPTRLHTTYAFKRVSL